ncbi:MAG: hypothetical protein M3N41_10400 [Acidobacteriota bacterium]|nr:hypothetical protein [Acidobacteriota bacterium]
MFITETAATQAASDSEVRQTVEAILANMLRRAGTRRRHIACVKRYRKILTRYCLDPYLMVGFILKREARGNAKEYAGCDALVNGGGTPRFVKQSDLDALDDALIDTILATNIGRAFAALLLPSTPIPTLTFTVGAFGR